MTNWKLGLVVLVVVAFGVGLYVQRPREREFQGRGLSKWLDDLDNRTAPEKREAATQVLRQMGTNVVPSLLEMLGAKASFSKRQMANTVAQTEFAHQRALNGFQALGPVSLPALTNLLHGETAATAAQALSQIGPEGVPPLVRALTNESAEVRQRILLGLEAKGPSSEALIPILIQNLKDRDEKVRAYAAGALGRTGLDPNRVVPALIATLQDSSAEVRLLTTQALGQFGPKAEAAIGPLLATVKDKDHQVSKAASRALILIAPDAAAKVGLR